MSQTGGNAPKDLTDDNDLLSRMGLSEDEYREFIQKYSEFASSLTANQKTFLQKMLPNAQQAAEMLGQGVTAERLTEFIRSRDVGKGGVTSHNVNIKLV
jgi:hypothetical protein